MGASCLGKKTIRVLLVDDQPAVRQGLRIRLVLEPDVEVVGEAGDGAGAISLAQSLRPDVILMDVKMPNTDGIEATAVLRERIPGSAVVILSLYDDARTRARAWEAGAASFVAKHEVETLLLDTVRQVACETRKRVTP